MLHYVRKSLLSIANLWIFRPAFWLLFILPILGGLAEAQTFPADGVDARTDTSSLARLLGSDDPSQRQRAAEALAQLAASDQKKLIEGYYLQEKNKNVRLALEWALYRTGKAEALFRIVRELDSGRHDQSVGYLSQLGSPDLIYPFLRREANKPKVIVGLIEALERSGDTQTLEHLEKYRDSLLPGVAVAAERAIETINSRTAGPLPESPGRPRTVVKPESTTP